MAAPIAGGCNRPSAQSRSADWESSSGAAFYVRIHDVTTREFAYRPGRADIAMPVDLKIDDDSFVAMSTNLGVGGLFVTTNRPCQVGDRLALRFALPDRDRPISVAAEVRWTRQERSPNSEGHASGMGLRFVDLPVGAFISIQELLRSQG
jgi:uncharacterized protein (TIGR02266 family)